MGGNLIMDSNIKRSIILENYQDANNRGIPDKDGYIKTSECKDFNELKDFVSSSNVLSLNNN